MESIGRVIEKLKFKEIEIENIIEKVRIAIKNIERFR